MRSGLTVLVVAGVLAIGTGATLAVAGGSSLGLSSGHMSAAVGQYHEPGPPGPPGPSGPTGPPACEPKKNPGCAGEERGHGERGKGKGHKSEENGGKKKKKKKKKVRRVHRPRRRARGHTVTHG